MSGAGKHQRVASSTRDPDLPMSLGQWFAQRTGVELVQQKGQESGLQKAG